MLFIPDLFHYWMTGIKVNEYTDASTSQMIDPGSRTWARDLIRAFGIPEKILGTLVQPGTVLGPLAAQRRQPGRRCVDSGDRAGDARHRRRRRRRPRARRIVGVHQLRHLVADGGRDEDAADR